MIRRTLLALAVLLAAEPARAEYRLGTGDVVEVAVFGMQDFRRRVTVDIDGTVPLPFLGEARAAGLTLAALREAVTRGLEANGTVRGPVVTVELIEHRPFYIAGDVARPGALAYRAGMTVRHAVAVAGGYDALRFRAENPLLAAPELQSQYDSHWIELVRRQARSISLQAEIDGRDTIDLAVLRQAPVPGRIVEEIAALESRDLAVRTADFRRERQSIEQVAGQIRASIASLDKALRDSETAIEQQNLATERNTGNAARGITPTYRLDEDRRALAMLRTQQVDATARLAQARRDLTETERRLERTIGERQSRLVQSLQAVLVELERERSQVRSAGERLLYTGALKAQMRGAGRGPDIVIHRRSADGTERIAAEEGTPIQPDDVIEVVIRPDQLVVSSGGGATAAALVR
ncbi:polysaccharide biosynthesis/export family protein [Methylobacterium oryzihabitans]|uniref:Exopolysaccharide biosynthesis protein n=1 Tax=Methylobacterium oryzihabitans TaxID=2499852 RepID=A0A3S2V5D2_9HYPH|nr:polysaccharide biosynthesis/export family protein [Methylobacterium oryzihabitans]RVU15946.1 exopolysaccharide biosynthesis protein [Methylobacterium oryzihabitans]